MLPLPTDPNFPEALKSAREGMGLTFSQLARAVDISPVMPARYENREHSNYCRPNQKTWQALNQVLFGSGINPEAIGVDVQRAYLDEATSEDIIAELRSRNVKLAFEDLVCLMRVSPEQPGALFGRALRGQPVAVDSLDTDALREERKTLVSALTLLMKVTTDFPWLSKLPSAYDEIGDRFERVKAELAKRAERRY